MLKIMDEQKTTRRINETGIINALDEKYTAIAELMQRLKYT